MPSGRAGRPIAGAGDPMPVVASYNIHRCIGRDGQTAPERIAAVIRELGADIVALQEVDALHGSGGELDQWVLLARMLGCECVPGISLRTSRRSYGNAILLRAPPAAVRLHDLSVERREPRGAIDLDVVLGGRLVRVVATHLGLSRAERRQQISRLLEILAAGPERSGTILLGDFNEWLPGSTNLRALGQGFHAAHAPATFPSNRPLLALDRILCRGEARPAGMTVHRSPQARIASDHLPIRAVMEWPGSD